VSLARASGRRGLHRVVLQEVVREVLDRVGGPVLDELAHAHEQDRHDGLVEVCACMAGRIMRSESAALRARGARATRARSGRRQDRRAAPPRLSEMSPPSRLRRPPSSAGGAGVGARACARARVRAREREKESERTPTAPTAARPVRNSASPQLTRPDRELLQLDGRCCRRAAAASTAAAAAAHRLLARRVRVRHLRSSSRASVSGLHRAEDVTIFENRA
jgi:hypothetical protein